MRPTLFSRQGIIAALIIASVGAAAVGLVTTQPACQLTPAQAAEASAIAGPACADAGGAVSTFLGPAGGLVALICQGIESEIIAAETVEPVDAGAPAPVTSVDGGAPLAAASHRHARFHVDPHCVAVPIPGDPLHQWACPELHAQILAAEARIAARKAARR